MQLNIDFIFAAFKRFYNYKDNETINFLRLLVIKHLNAKKAKNKKIVSNLLTTFLLFAFFAFKCLITNDLIKLIVSLLL